MNIFILDKNIDKCAEYHVDKHIVKMPLEAAQMLCTNQWIDTYLGFRPYKIPKEELQLLRKTPKPEGVKYAFAMPKPEYGGNGEPHHPSAISEHLSAFLLSVK